VFGTNAIFAFALSSVITTLADRIHVGVGASGSRVSLHQWGYQQLFATWLPPINASLAYAVMIVLLNLVLVYPLYRKRIFLRI
jgi:predicted acyltransferase